MTRREFENLLSASSADVIRLAMRLTGNRADAEDLAQESLLRALRGYSVFRSRSSVRTWVMRIAINAFRDRLRRRSPVVSEVAEPVAPRVVSPVALATSAETGALVAAAVSALPARQREVVVLCVYEGLTPTDAAGVLGVSANNVRATLSIAREKLREQLAREMS